MTVSLHCCQFIQSKVTLTVRYFTVINICVTLLNNYYKDAYCVVGKELTKCYESILYGNPSQILDTLTDDILKGEWCFIVSLPKEKKEFNTAFIKQACELGLTQNQIGTLAKTLGWNKKEVYNYVLNYKQD